MIAWLTSLLCWTCEMAPFSWKFFQAGYRIGFEAYWETWWSIQKTCDELSSSNNLIFRPSSMLMGSAWTVLSSDSDFPKEYTFFLPVTSSFSSQSAGLCLEDTTEYTAKNSHSSTTSTYSEERDLDPFRTCGYCWLVRFFYCIPFSISDFCWN